MSKKTKQFATCLAWHTPKKTSLKGDEITFRMQSPSGSWYSLYKVNLATGKERMRNIEHWGLAGTRVIFPGAQTTFMGGGRTWKAEGLEKWRTRKGRRIYDFAGCHKLTQADIEQIADAHKEKSYFLRKLKQPDIYSVIKVLKAPAWAEYVYAAGYHKLAWDGRLWKASKETLRKIRSVLNKQPKDIAWDELRLMLKKGYTQEEAQVCLAQKTTDLREAQYKQKHRAWEYYIRMAKALGYDTDDEYHRYPKDFDKTYHDIIQQCDRRAAIQRAQEQAERREEENRREQEKLEARVAKDAKLAEAIAIVKAALAKYTPLEENGMVAHIPMDYEDVCEQADALNQCLVECDYWGSMITGEDVLVFIADDKRNRLATVEFDSKGAIKQAYKDEESDDIYASDEMQELAERLYRTHSRALQAAQRRAKTIINN